MASSNSEKIDSIVDKKVLDELSALDKALDNTSTHFVSLLQNVDKVESQLNKASTSYGKLVDAINKYDKINNQVDQAERERQRQLTELERLRQRSIQSTSQEAREIVALRREIQLNNREQTLQSRITNASTGSLEQQRARLSLLRQQWDRMSESVRNSPLGERYRREIEHLNSSLTELEGTTGRFQRSVGKYPEGGFFKTILSGNFSGALSVLGGNLMTKAIEGIGALTSKISEFVSESIEMASKAEGVRTAFEKLDQPDLLSNLRKETKGTVNDLDLMQSAVKAENFNIPLNQLGLLLKFAQQRAQETGESVDYLVDSIVNGIGRKSPLILDNLGISASRLKEEVKNTGDFAQAAINIVNEELEKQGDLALTAADKAAQSTVRWQNAQLNLGEKILFVKNIWSAFSGETADFLNKLIDKYFPRLLEEIEKAINGIIDLYNNSVIFRGAVQGLIAWWKTFFDLFKTNIKISIEIFNEFINFVKAGFDLDPKGMFDAFNNFNKKVIEIGKNSANSIKNNLQDAFDSINVKLDKVDLKDYINAVGTYKPRATTGNTNLANSKSNDDAKKRADTEAKASKELAEYKAKLIVDLNKEIVADDKKSYEERLSALSAYIQSQKDSIELSRKNQLDNSKLTASQIELINLKANTEIAKVDEESEKLRLSITKKYTEERIKEIRKEVSASSDAIGAKEKADLADLAETYNAGNGTIKSEQYEYERTEITRKAAMERYEIQVQAAKDALAIEGLTLEQREALEQNLGKARIDYENYVNDTIVQNEEKAAKTREQIEQQLADKRKEIIGDALNFIGDLYNSQFERQLQNLKSEEDANKEQAEKQKEQIRENVDFGNITKEEAYIQQETLDRVAEERQDALAEKRRTIQNRQAKMERAMALANIIQDTASSILKIKAQAAVLLANPFTAPYAAIALAQIPLVIASSAAQTAAILATPLPQYKYGTSDHKGGAAIVGDGGKHELGILPDGKYFKTPNNPTIMDLPKHTVIMPDYEKAVQQISMTQAMIKPIENGTIIIQDNKNQLDLMRKQTQEVAALHRTLKSGLAYRPIDLGNWWR